jgi:hypothetical protein
MIDSGKKLFGKPVMILEPGEDLLDQSKHLPAVKIVNREAVEQLGYEIRKRLAQIHFRQDFRAFLAKKTRRQA